MKKFNFKNFSIRKLDLSSHNVRFLSKYRIWFAVPLVVILVAIIVFSIFSAVNKDVETGMNLGIDFTGGTVMTVAVGSELDNDSTYNSYKNALTKIIEDEGYNVGNVQKSDKGADARIIIKYQNKDADLESSNQAIKDKILATYPKLSEEDVSLESISASSAQDLLSKALISLAVIFVVMLVYIAIRFELWSGISALIGLIHDVIMMIALTIIFHIEVNTTYVAAVITIVAYSINNTIIVFDRVRETMRLAPKTGKIKLDSYVEEAVNDTFTRSAVSTVTTMIPVFLLGCFGVVSMRQFAWPIMFGLIAGTYSSLILAPTVYYMIRTALNNRKLKKSMSPAPTQKSKKKDDMSDVMSMRKRNNA
ncbi:MAG TPA: protein translocase subunit SecF [Clostridiales bacterium]|nr:protein translocase subunit SecF [Clostridiales bacterium]